MRRTVAAVVMLMGGVTIAHAGITLRNDVWELQVEPGTVGVTAKVAGGGLIPISAGGAAGDVVDLKADATTARWVVGDDRVSMRLDGDTLAVAVVAKQPGRVTFPVIAGDERVEALILPMGEGNYVPTADGDWAEFLETRGPFDTTADLSMPFVGVEAGAHTVTYVFENPFNNQIAFRRDGGKIAAAVTHTFTSNHQVHEYGVRISLGGHSPVEPARRFRKYLVEKKEFVSLADKIAERPDTAKLMGAPHIYLWGDGVTAEFVTTLKKAGIDRAWLGVDGTEKLRQQPETIGAAKEAGYLLGLYDSYHSIHRPGQADTWETAQFDQALYDTGGITNADGSVRKGFQQKGKLLSPKAARPYVERRVTKWHEEFPLNSWFVDCDAFGQVYDDYSPAHPMTAAEDMAERVSRMKWVGDHFGMVVGSEGGSSYAAPAIAFAHGVETPVIGWGDADLKDRKSEYFLGAYWPPDGPNVFFKSVPLKPYYEKFYFDPRYRLPLYEVALHDSVVATHHWSFGSLKLKDQAARRELAELLYGVPPLYHLNSKEWAKRRETILAHYKVFSPLHRRIGGMEMTAFEWLTADRLVQRTVFGNDMEVVANFSTKTYRHEGTEIPAGGGMLRELSNGQTTVYTTGK